MEYNNYDLYFGVFDDYDTDDFNECGVSGGQLLTEKAVDELFRKRIYPWESLPPKGTFFVWLGSKGYIYQKSARKVTKNDLILLSRGLSNQSDNFSRHSYFKLRYRGRKFRGTTCTYRRHSYINNSAKNTFTVDDWMDDYPLLKNKNKRQRTYLSEIATEWADEFPHRSSNSWKDSTKKRKQYNRHEKN